MNRYRYLFVGFCVVAVILLLMFRSLLAPIDDPEMQTIRRELQSDLGFSLATPFVHTGSKEIEVIEMQTVQPGGVLDKAGMRTGDLLVWETHDTNDIYRFLEERRGKQVELRVVNGGDGPPLGERAIRVIAFLVPHKEKVSEKKRAQ